MNIGIIGAGHVGGSLGATWTRAGHTVVFGVRDPESASSRTVLASIGKGAKAASLVDAARADVVVLTTPWPATRDAIAACGNLAGKIVIDCTNPVKSDLSGLEIGHTTSAGEQVAQWAKGASVYKAFNQTGAGNMASQEGYPAKLVMFVAGDDATKKPTVLGLVRDAGFDAVDAGPMVAARWLEPMAMLWIHLAVHQKFGPDFAFVLVKRKPRPA
jgi:predicted dinucleotide-binding enzyme